MNDDLDPPVSAPGGMPIPAKPEDEPDFILPPRETAVAPPAVAHKL